MTSLVKTLTLQRVESCLPYLDPVQWSDNQQLAINNGWQITILDPKLPSFNSSITQVENVKVLDPKTLFQVTNVLHGEILDSLPLRRLNNVTVETLDESFSFGPISDVNIVSHQWSATDPCTRDNFLGVMFNTGELLIFERDTIYIDRLMVKVSVLEFLCREYNVSLADPNNIVVTNTQLQSIKINSFAFTHLPNLKNTLLLSLTTNAGSLLFYEYGSSCSVANQRGSVNPNALVLKGKIDLLESAYNGDGTRIPGYEILKQTWSSWSSLPDGTYTAYVLLTFSNNSVVLYHLKYDYTIECLSVQTISPKSRFLVQKHVLLAQNNQTYVVTGSTGSISVFEISSGRKSTHKLSNFTSITDINHIPVDPQTVKINVSFENGRFEAFTLDLAQLSWSPQSPHYKLTSFIKKALYSYQLLNTDEDNDDDAQPVKQEDDLSVPETGSSAPEGSFICYGCKINPHGLVTLVFRIVPKDVLYYQISSKKELQVAFIKVDDFKSVSLDFVPKTSIGYLNEYWLREPSRIPIFPGSNSLDELPPVEQYYEFIERIKELKAQDFEPFPDRSDPVLGDLTDSLIDSFNQSVAVKKRQTLYTLNTMLLTSLSSVTIEDAKITDYISSVSNENRGTVLKLTFFLIQHCMEYLALNGLGSSPIDGFVSIQFFQRLKKLDPAYHRPFKHIVPAESEITIKTRFFEESFRATSGDIVTNLGTLLDSTTLLNSTTNHKWSKCALTNLPLLQLNNKKDELGLFNYILYDPSVMENENDMVVQLLMAVQYCYITGNKTYIVK